MGVTLPHEPFISKSRHGAEFGPQAAEPWSRIQKDLNQAVRLGEAQTLFPAAHSHPVRLKVRLYVGDPCRVSVGGC